MGSTNDYRSNAEDCLRMAREAQNAHDKPFWLTLAQSWLQLAEHSKRGTGECDAEGTRVVGADTH
jgi:hypothetical protein